MNGRVYDYNVGRFLSVDPFVHGAGNSQGINPYSYILNNPLAGTDPSGYAPDFLSQCGGNPYCDSTKPLPITGSSEYNCMKYCVSASNGGSESDSDSANSSNGTNVTPEEIASPGKIAIGSHITTGFDGKPVETITITPNLDNGFMSKFLNFFGSGGGGWISGLESFQQKNAMFGNFPCENSGTCLSSNQMSIISHSPDIAAAGGNAEIIKIIGLRASLALSSIQTEAAFVPMTVANSTRGWKVGDPINNLTKAGNVPSWSAVRARFWKNEALNNAETYSASNFKRMQKGLAPQRINPTTGKIESMELHHSPAQRDGGLFDVKKVWPDEHAAIDPFRNTGN